MEDNAIPEKSDYELARDARVKLIQRQFDFQPLQNAATVFNLALRKENAAVRPALKVVGRASQQPRRSARLKVHWRSEDAARLVGTKKKADQDSDMSSDEMSAGSGDTKSDYDPKMADAVDSSSDEEIQPPQMPLLVRKRPKTMSSMALVPAGHDASHMPPPGYWGPSPWLQPPWMQPPAMQSQQWHSGVGAPPIPYHPSWSGAPLPEGIRTLESEGRAARRHKRHRNESAVAARDAGGLKPHELVVKAGGEIDITCEGKTAWDHAVRISTPRILDMSVVDWESQKPAAVALLRETLDKDFEYVGHSLSAHGFRSAIKKYMKAERARLKAKFVGGKEACPVHIDPPQWDKLKDYWKTELQVAKTAKMVHARAHVKDYSTMGRRGRVGKELAVTGRKERSPSLTEIAGGMHESRGNNSVMLGGKGAMHDRLMALEEKQNNMADKQKDMEGKMTELLLNQSASNISIDEVKSMLKHCMERFPSNEGFSPSVGISAVETQVQLGSTKHQLVASRSNTPFKAPAPVVSMHVSEGTSDSAPSKSMPSKIKSKDLTPVLQGQLTDDALQSDAMNNADLVSCATPSAVAALVHLGRPVGQTESTLKEPAEVVLEEQTVGVDSITTVVPEVEQVEKAALPQSSAADAKKPSRARKLKKGAESTEEAPPNNDKAITETEVVELSASGSPEVVPRPPRISPRPKKVPAQSPIEGTAAQEEEPVKTRSGRREPKPKPPPKKKSTPDKFVLGQEVYLLNSRNLKQSVAAGTISGIGGVDKFHFVMIPDSVYKVNVTEAIWPQVQLMFPNLNDEQTKVKDALGGACLWEGKFIKAYK